MKIKALLEESITRINSFSDTPQLDAQVLIAHVIGKPRAWIMAHTDHDVTEKDQINSALQRLEAGEPLPYVLGKWEFFGLEFDITKDVLIPRPETELLVEKAIAWLQASPDRRTIADIGTGSGVIAASIAMHVPDARILATDISFAALKVAQHNARKFHVHHLIDFLQCDLLLQHIDNLSTARHFDLICANPPYIPTETLRQLPIFDCEPTLALDGGADGLDVYRRLFKLAPDWLAPQGMMLIETEASLGVQALSLAYDMFSDVNIHLHQDLAGHDRLLEIMFL
ncbi:MAG: peptide chain release factor N(5)-glutamine methyltransferase [Anaerolineales bacterium]|nr:peptide chain release factor N(5)-glutamine methyltransferase [Anaerolineales bacterium]